MTNWDLKEAIAVNRVHGGGRRTSGRGNSMRKGPVMGGPMAYVEN